MALCAFRTPGAGGRQYVVVAACDESGTVRSSGEQDGCTLTVKQLPNSRSGLLSDRVFDLGRRRALHRSVASRDTPVEPSRRAWLDLTDPGRDRRLTSCVEPRQQQPFGLRVVFRTLVAEFPYGFPTRAIVLPDFDPQRPLP